MGRFKLDKAEQMIKKVVDACTDCDCCRDLMDDNSCLFFPELYRLCDEGKQTGKEMTSFQLRHLADLCNYCALCPCANIREDIITAKTLFIDRDGLDPYIRTLEDVEKVGKICGAIPRLSNFLLQKHPASAFIKKSVGIHPKRKLPLFPKEHFPSWAKKQNLHKKSGSKKKRKVAYFAGCTARYLLPNVPKAAVDVFQRNEIEIFYPEQNCCGMPSMLEGDRKQTLSFAERAVSELAEAVKDGYDVVCSCPTCGYMLKNVIQKGAYYSKEYQAFVGGDETHLKIPQKMPPKWVDSCESSIPGQFRARFGGHHIADETIKMEDTARETVREVPFQRLDKSIYGGILKDEGYFTGINPLNRVKVAENTFDLGEYLMGLCLEGELDQRFGEFPGQMLYYPPCHLREQGIGMPYLRLLSLIPDVSIDYLQGSFLCCGIAGIMGFKRCFHNTAIQMGSRLMGEIKRLNPDHLTTDCLSCRLQFNQMSTYRVRHPIEILSEAYKNAEHGQMSRTGVAV